MRRRLAAAWHGLRWRLSGAGRHEAELRRIRRESAAALRRYDDAHGTSLARLVAAPPAARHEPQGPDPEPRYGERSTR